MTEQANYQLEHIMELVEEAVRSLRPHLYRHNEDGRLSFYTILLGEVCDLMTIDGGPSYARVMLEGSCNSLRADEALRGSEEIGPHLSDEQCQALFDDPSLDLRPKWRSGGGQSPVSV